MILRIRPLSDRPWHRLQVRSVKVAEKVGPLKYRGPGDGGHAETSAADQVSSLHGAHLRRVSPATSLLLVRRNVQAQIRKEIFADLQNSVSTFQNFQRERETTLSHSADLLADLPNLRALMTTQHEATIQDGSDSSLAIGRQRSVCPGRPDRRGGGAAHLIARLHSRNGAGIARCFFESARTKSLVVRRTTSLPSISQAHLFWPGAENRLLGFLVIGYEIDDRVASQLSRIAASQVAFYYDNTIVKTHAHCRRTKSELGPAGVRSSRSRLGS